MAMNERSGSDQYRATKPDPERECVHCGAIMGGLELICVICRKVCPTAAFGLSDGEKRALVADDYLVNRMLERYRKHRARLPWWRRWLYKLMNERGVRRLTCLFIGHDWTEMRERGELDFFRECKRCGKFWKIGLWTEDIPVPPPAPGFEWLDNPDNLSKEYAGEKGRAMEHDPAKMTEHELLRKYMEHVVGCEGVSFVLNISDGWGGGRTR